MARVARPASAATTSVAPERTRKRRRGDPGTSSAGIAPPARAAVDPGAAGSSTVRASSPAAAPSSDGRASMGIAVGRLSAAMVPTRPSPATPSQPTQRQRVATMPRMAAARSSVLPIPSSSASLSRSPNVAIANDLSHSGVASMNAPPTTTMGDAARPMMAAASSPTTRATIAAMTPAVAPMRRRDLGEIDAGAVSAWAGCIPSRTRHPPVWMTTDGTRVVRSPRLRVGRLLQAAPVGCLELDRGVLDIEVTRQAATDVVEDP